MLTRRRLLFFVLITAMLFVALAPGELVAPLGTGDNRHAFAFAVLPLVSAVAWPRIDLRVQFAAYAALGGAIELAQAVIHNFHTPEWDDWLTDIGAAAVALGLVWAVRRYRRRD
jgi:hypothetical protein